jgi:hypothetical protein
MILNCNLQDNKTTEKIFLKISAVSVVFCDEIFFFGTGILLKKCCSSPSQPLRQTRYNIIVNLFFLEEISRLSYEMGL